MGLFGGHPGALTREDSAVGQALDGVATISILEERPFSESALVNEQLQRTLNSRILIEQAKAVIAHTAGVNMEKAFRLFARGARSRIRRRRRRHLE